MSRTLENGTVKRLTNSEMSVWRECKRKWYLSTFRQLQRRGKTQFNTALGIGDRVHEALRVYYDPNDDTDPVQFINATCDKDGDDHPDRMDAIEKERLTCVAMVEGYLQWLEESGADEDFRVIESEKAREANIFGEVNLLAKLDARVERISDGRRFSLEHKTGAMGVEPTVLQINTQMLTQHLVELLALLESGGEPDEATGVIVNFLKKSKRTARAKPPFYWRETVFHNKEELRNHWWHVYTIATEIIEAEDKLEYGVSHHEVCYPSPSSDCQWKCEFLTVCSMMDDGSQVEAAIEDLYETHDPLERYTLG